MRTGRYTATNRAIAGIGLLLFGSVLVGGGVHHVVQIGTCSSTGYTRWGPAAYCPSGTGTWIGLVAAGLVLGVIGGMISGPGALFIIPALFVAIGAGSFTAGLHHSATASPGFELAFGGGFLAVGLIPVLIGVGSSLTGSRAR